MHFRNSVITNEKRCRGLHQNQVLSFVSKLALPCWMIVFASIFPPKIQLVYILKAKCIHDFKQENQCCLWTKKCKQNCNDNCFGKICKHLHNLKSKTYEIAYEKAYRDNK